MSWYQKCPEPEHRKEPRKYKSTRMKFIKLSDFPLEKQHYYRLKILAGDHVSYKHAPVEFIDSVYKEMGKKLLYSEWLERTKASRDRRRLNASYRWRRKRDNLIAERLKKKVGIALKLGEGTGNWEPYDTLLFKKTYDKDGWRIPRNIIEKKDIQEDWDNRGPGYYGKKLENSYPRYLVKPGDGFKFPNSSSTKLWVLKSCSMRGIKAQLFGVYGEENMVWVEVVSLRAPKTQLRLSAKIAVLRWAIYQHHDLYLLDSDSPEFRKEIIEERKRVLSEDQHYNDAVMMEKFKEGLDEEIPHVETVMKEFHSKMREMDRLDAINRKTKYYKQKTIERADKYRKVRRKRIKRDAYRLSYEQYVEKCVCRENFSKMRKKSRLILRLYTKALTGVKIKRPAIFRVKRTVFPVSVANS